MPWKDAPISASFAVGPLLVVVARADDYRSSSRTAPVVDDLSGGAKDALAVRVYDSDTEEALLLVLVAPTESGSVHGVRLAYLPCSVLLFIGAGEILSAYAFGPARRLWVYAPEAGVHELRVHGDIVVVTAELEMAAWDTAGRQLWTRFVEPPWGYRVEKGVVTLDIMGELSQFPLRTGPG